MMDTYRAMEPQLIAFIQSIERVHVDAEASNGRVIGGRHPRHADLDRHAS